MYMLKQEAVVDIQGEFCELEFIINQNAVYLVTILLFSTWLPFKFISFVDNIICSIVIE